MPLLYIFQDSDHETKLSIRKHPKSYMKAKNRCSNSDSHWSYRSRVSSHHCSPSHTEAPSYTGPQVTMAWWSENRLGLDRARDRGMDRGASVIDSPCVLGAMSNCRGQSGAKGLEGQRSWLTTCCDAARVSQHLRVLNFSLFFVLCCLGCRIWPPSLSRLAA